MFRKITLLLVSIVAVVLIFYVKTIALFDFINNGNSKEISDSRPSFPAELLLRNGTGTLSVEFEGAQNTDLIVISIDSKEAAENKRRHLAP